VALAQDHGMMRGQHGQVMAFIAVALAIVLMPLAAYAIDIATVSAAASALQGATATAAIEAAQQLDEVGFRASGVMAVDASMAKRAAQAVLAAETPSASVTSVTVSGAEVTVAAGELVQLPVDFLPTRRIRIEARASARLAGGYDSPSSRLPLSISTF
jgi:Flp pilus assembly protein TadG